MKTVVLMGELGDINKLPTTSDASVAFVNAGYTLMQQGNNQAAIQEFEKALSANPKNSLAWLGKGQALYNTGNSRDAITAFDNSILNDPTNSEAWASKGNVLISLGNFTEALECTDRATTINPGNQWAWAFKGDALFGLYRCDEAKVAYNKSLIINPDNAVAQKGLQMAENPTICKPKATLQQSTISNQAFSGDIVQDQTWSGEVRVTGEIRLAKDVTLKIEPGTVVYLSPNSNDQHPSGYDASDDYTTKYNDPVRLASWSSNAINIDCRYGIIEVMGTPENPVIFKPEGSSTSPGQWNGILIGRGKIQYARLYSAGQTAMNIFGDYPGTVEIAHNEVKYFHWAGIDSHRNNVWIHDNIVEGGGHQGIGVRYNTLAENNTVSRAETGIGVEDANGAVIRHNTVIDCPVGIGLRSGTSAEVTDNTIPCVIG